jgi:hypothetical protein
MGVCAGYDGIVLFDCEAQAHWALGLPARSGAHGLANAHPTHRATGELREGMVAGSRFDITLLDQPG